MDVLELAKRVDKYGGIEFMLDKMAEEGLSVDPSKTAEEYNKTDNPALRALVLMKLIANHDSSRHHRQFASVVLRFLQRSVKRCSRSYYYWPVPGLIALKSVACDLNMSCLNDIDSRSLETAGRQLNSCRAAAQRRRLHGR